MSVQAATSYTYTSFDYPGADATVALGIDGSNIVGWFRDGNFDYHSFQATSVVPLPPAAWMAVPLFGVLGVARKIRCVRREVK